MATIALDIGGTKIASAIFFPDGSMMFNRKRLLKGRTGHEVGKLAADILAKLLTVARRSRIHVDGIGVCIPGIVYSQTNRVWAPNIPGWDNYPLYEELRSVTPPGIEIYIDSDRTCYMYGEMWQGADRVGQGHYCPLPPSEPYMRVSPHTAQAFLNLCLYAETGSYYFLFPLVLRDNLKHSS